MVDAGGDPGGDALKDHEDLDERFEREGDESNATNPLDLTFKKLRQLQDKFHTVDANGNKQPINLSIDQFVDALSFNRSRGGDAHQEDWQEELRTLFKKIDASCCNTVNWEEFTNFMLLHLPVLGQGDGACEFSQVERSDALAAGWGSGHTDMINSVITIGADAGAPRRYVTAGRDGVVKIWNSSLQLHKVIEVGQHKNWLSSCAWMKQSKRLAVASSDFAIFFYDNSFSPTPVSKIEHPQGTPLCLGYHELQGSGGWGKEILMVGDNYGYVTLYQMDDDWYAWPLNDNPHSQGGAGGYGQKGGNDRSRNLARGGTRAIEKDDEEAGGEAALRGSKGVKSGRDAGTDNKMQFHGVKLSREKYHNDWVTKVGFVSELQAMVTCGLDGEINLCDVQKNERKRDPIRLHKNSVHSWCWCINYKFFASCGLDRQIIIWNPYTLKAMNFLQGHNASIHEVLVNERQHQLISLSVDKVVKVWDIRNYRCIQTFTDKTEYKPEDRLTCMAFDEEGPALVLCSSTLNLLPVNVKVESSRTHRAAIVCALYNDVFHQVVSGDIAGTICVWDVKSGKLEFEFRRVHADHKLTCMAFDESKRRLYTGSDDGTIKLFNFSSGQALRSYVKSNQSEITGLLTAREGPNPFVVGVAWDRKIYVWNDSKKQTVETSNVLEDPHGAGHVDDISCICSLAPTQKGMLATGGEDGWVILWKIQEGATNSAGRSIKCRLKDETPHVQIDNSQPGPKDIASRPKNKKPTPQDGHGADSGVDQAAALPHVSKAGSQAKQAQMSRLSTMAQIDKKKGAPGAVENEVTGALGEKAAGQVGGGNATIAPSALPAADGDASEGAQFCGLPEELGFSGDAEFSSPSVGVEKMIYLEHKECLLSTHSDHYLRVWSVKNYAFVQRLTLGETADKAARAATSGSGAAGESATAPLTTAIHSDQAANQWLFTGDADGFVKIWDMSEFHPHKHGAPPLKTLIELQCFQPHRQAVTQIQYFELEGKQIVMSAGADCTVSLSTAEGERIGTFSAKGRPWRLSEESTWSAELPPMEEGNRRKEDDDFSWRSPRRPGTKGGGRAKGSAGGGAQGPMDYGRSPRAAQSRLKISTTTTQASRTYCGRGVFSELSAVEKHQPDPELAEKAWEERYRRKVQEYPAGGSLPTRSG
eukprot:gnl/MRDRNA2_/MRDRNA2_58967_c0_seq1.p1 gnl/MRDRNA2_/MRDRNA2_58967_c0~~gnl/MRDRNA2_/MRDRNA2_58967_c0_seq1.p1  ORF type:complete len:1155 (-),score=226.27 gnl/MRDRNA2_/MRDRNA2_58967_c0_seq1:93-3557(-)